MNHDLIIPSSGLVNFKLELPRLSKQVNNSALSFHSLLYLLEPINLLCKHNLSTAKVTSTFQCQDMNLNSDTVVECNKY